MNACASAIEGAAATLQAAGVGGHSVRGHQAVLARMANSLRAAGAQNQIPHTYDDGHGLYASVEASRFGELPGPVRHLADKAEIDLTADRSVTLAELDAAMAKADLAISDKFLLKGALISAGRIAA